MFEKNSRLRYHQVLPRRVTSSCLVKSPAAFLREEGKTTLLSSLGEAYLLLDYEEEVVGGVEVRVSCTAPAHIRIQYEETPEGALRTAQFECTWYKLVIDEYDLEAGEHVLISKGRRGFRYIAVFAESEKDVEFLSAKAENGGWPIQARGFFRCSDERLNRIWDISEATARACMQDYYEDGVKRDGLLWLGDYRVTFLSGYYASGDASLARRSLLMMRDSQYPNGAIPGCAARGGGQQHDSESGIAYMPNIPKFQNIWIIPNYICDYICGIEEYLRLTGDDSILPEIMDSAKKAAAFLMDMVDFETPGVWKIDEFQQKKDENGLCYTVLHDCTSNPKNNVESKGTLLLEMLGALRALGKLAAKTKDDALAAWSENMEARLDSHIMTHYYNKEQGRYLDSVNQRPVSTLMFPASRAALLGKDDPIGMDQLVRGCMPNLGFAMAWKIEAMFKQGFYRETLEAIRKSWGKMLDHGSLTCWERLDVPEMDASHYYDAPGSCCHGWTSGPAWQLPAWITGVQSEKDGFAEVRIAPNLVDLTWAEATVPTPSGEILVRAERCEKTGVMTLTLDIPEATKACTVIWPDGVEESIPYGQHRLTH
ncbi:MAG: hypothetical protein J6B85_05855 [Lachnospiraceae bacterium]|nr:hypothetical protein [Lachnospiraceae bacterium]